MTKSRKKRISEKPAEEMQEVYYKKFFGEKYYSRTEILYLSLIIFCGLILRLIYFFETEGTPFFTSLYSDSKIYFDWASEIVASGNWVGSEVYFMSPVYPYFLAVATAISSESITLVRIIQVIASSLNIWVIYLIARNLFSTKAGYAASILAAVYSIFIFYSGAILSETLQTFIVSMLVLLLVNVSMFEEKDELEKTKDRWLWIGLLLGFSSLFRANILLFFLGAVVWLFFHYRKDEKLKTILKPALIYLFLGTALPVFVVTVRNYVVSGEFVLLTSNGGINFYIGNNDDALGVFKTPEGFDFFSDMSGKNYAEKLTGTELTASEASSFWYRKGFNYISEKPAGAAILTLKKLLLFFDNSENPQSTIMDLDFFARNYSKLLSLPLPGFYLIFLLSIAGFILTWKNRNRLKLIYFLICLYILSVVIFFIIGRFRVAIAPVFIVFAGAALVEMYNLLRAKKFKPIFISAGVVILFVLVESFASPKFNYSDYDAYINLGNTAFENKEYDKALTYYRKSLQSESSYLTYVLIGNTLAVRGDINAAEYSYQKAIELNNKYELSYFNLGLLYSQTNQIEKAINQFNKVIEINPKFSDAYRNLAIALYIKEEYQAALEYFEKYLPMVKGEELKKSVIQDIENIKKLLKKNDG